MGCAPSQRICNFPGSNETVLIFQKLNPENVFAMTQDKTTESWEFIAQLVSKGKTKELENFLESLSPSEKVLAFSRLDEEIHSLVVKSLSTEAAADLMEDLNDDQAADLIEELSEAEAAAIVDEMASDEQADVLGHLEDEKAEAILQKMTPDEAADARRLLQSQPDTAGGLMITEYLHYPASKLAKDVVTDLRERGEEYSDDEVQYIYVTDPDGKLAGVLPIWKLIRASSRSSLSNLSLFDPIYVSEDTPLSELKDVIERHNFMGIPVTDQEGKLVGLVKRKSILEAIDEMDNKAFLNFSGIVGGEEHRSMPLLSRTFHRLSWLSVNIILNIIAASVILFYQDTLAAAIALAVFLPIISDMSGCSGNQAVAVSIRELSTGQVKPNEILRVLAKEASVGMINGLVLGILVGAVALIWKGNFYLGAVVGGALAINSVFAVCLGGSIPLVLRRMEMDPALASSPILTTITDMAGFFLVLSLATLALPNIGA